MRGPIHRSALASHPKHGRGRDAGSQPELPTVSKHLLLSLGFGVAPVLVVISILAARFPNPKIDLMHAVAAYLQATGLSQLLTSIIKKAVGRPRPSFYAECGWDDALQQCTAASQTVRWDARMSFPSGHSSLSFVAMTFLTCLLIHLLHKRHVPRPAFLPPMIIYLAAMLPIFVAGFVAISRLWDFRHHYSDVLAGSLLGMFVAKGVFSVHFSRREITYPHSFDGMGPHTEV